MKYIALWAVISSVCLVSPGSRVMAQSSVEPEPQAKCQLRNPSRPNSSSGEAATDSIEALLAEEIEAMCQLNGQRPRSEDSAIATDATPSPQDFTIPSLWWLQQQIGAALNNRLIDSWRAYDDAEENGKPIRHVDVVLNGQIWPLLTYLERYTVITQFGERAQSYGYQLRVFTGNRLVGLHVCDFTTDSSNPGCAVELNYLGQGAIRGGRQR